MDPQLPQEPAPEPLVPSVSGQHSSKALILFLIAVIFVVGASLSIAFYVAKNLATESLTTTSLEPTVTPTISRSPTIDTIPTVWKTYTAIDTGWGVQTTLSLPSEFSFTFKGSDFLIQKDSDASELWEYTTSIRGDEQGKGNNTFIEGTALSWYQQYFREVNGLTDNQILDFEEKTEKGITYFSVRAPSPLGIETHYVSEKNGIVHILKPSSAAALNTDSLIANNIAVIFYSLTSQKI